MNHLLLRRRELLVSLDEEAVRKLMLFALGDKCTDITSGWTMEKLTTTGNGGAGTFTTYGGEGCMQFSAASTSGYSNPRRMNFLSNSKIDTTGYTRLCIDWHGVKSTSVKMYLGLYSSNTAKETAYTRGGSFSASVALTRQTDYLDISAYQGSYYIGGFYYKAADVSSTHTARIFNLWLE